MGSIPAFLEMEPNIAVHHGRIYMDFGDLQLVLPIAAWRRNVALGNEAIAKWEYSRLGKSGVIQLPRH